MTKFYVLLITLLVVYLYYTVHSFLYIQKSQIFSRRIKIIHLIAIWIVPFIWAYLLKASMQPAPGSYQVERKGPDEPFFDAYDNSG
jgi:hypothetical protein